MTQKELIRLSLLLADTPEERHGVYARRKPVPPPRPRVPVYLMEDPTGFAPGCFVDFVPPEAA